MLILKQDKANYINKNIIRNLKSGSGLYLPGRCNYCGNGIYLPKGGGIMDIVSSLFKFVNSNTGSIKNLTDTASNVINLASATSKGVTDTIKNINDIRSQSQQISGKKGEAITPEALERIVSCSALPKKKKSGSGFIYY